MTQAEAAEALRNTNATLVKVGHETDSLLAKIEELNKALEAALAAGGQVTPELQDAIKAVDDQAHAIDSAVPDLPEVEPPDTPTNS